MTATSGSPDATTGRLLALAAAGEAATGLALIALPQAVTRLLIGAEPSEAGIALGRFMGMALLSLGVACWPRSRAAEGRSLALPAMLLYSGLATAYFLRLGLGGRLVGALLWPAAAHHAVLTILLARAFLRRRA